MQYHRKLRNVWLPFTFVFWFKTENFIQLGRLKIIKHFCKVETLSVKHWISTGSESIPLNQPLVLSVKISNHCLNIVLFPVCEKL